MWFDLMVGGEWSYPRHMNYFLEPIPHDGIKGWGALFPPQVGILDFLTLQVRPYSPLRNGGRMGRERWGGAGKGEGG